MDARSLFPQGHHPVRLNYSPDGVYQISPLNRQDRPVKYYFIDFGLSSHFKPGDTPLVVGTKGRDKEPPELSDTDPYNPFPLDIYILGNMYLHEFVQVSLSSIHSTQFYVKCSYVGRNITVSTFSKLSLYQCFNPNPLTVQPLQGVTPSSKESRLA